MTVVPFHLTYPGHTVRLPDAQERNQVDMLLSVCQGSLTEAAISLGAFIDCRGIRCPAQDPQAHEERLKAEWGVSYVPIERSDEFRMEVNRRLLRDTFAAGRWPAGCVVEMQFVHAKGFITALDIIQDTLKQCERFGAIQGSALAARTVIERGLPNLAEVRNSIAHIDARVQGLGRRAKMKLQGGSLFVDIIEGDNFKCTMADGQVGQVPITLASFNLCAKAVQDFIDGIKWQGVGRVAPFL